MKLNITLLTVIGTMLQSPASAQIHRDVEDVWNDAQDAAQTRGGHKHARGSFYDSNGSTPYANGANFSFDSAIVKADGISVDDSGTLFSIARPGYYLVSFAVRSSTTPFSVQVVLNGELVPGTQFTSTSATQSSAIGTVLVHVCKKCSTLSIQNTTGSTVTIPSGLDNALTIVRLEE